MKKLKRPQNLGMSPRQLSVKSVLHMIETKTFYNSILPQKAVLWRTALKSQDHFIKKRIYYSKERVPL